MSQVHCITISNLKYCSSIQHKSFSNLRKRIKDDSDLHKNLKVGFILVFLIFPHLKQYRIILFLLNK